MKKIAGNIKERTFQEFVKVGMEPTSENREILKSLHKRAVYAAMVILKYKKEYNDLPHLMADTSKVWDTPSYNEPINRAWFDAWIIPMRKHGESYRGYMSRLNAWAWQFVYANCCDISMYEYGSVEYGDYETEEIFEGFRPNIKMLGFISNITDYKAVYEESLESIT